MRRVRFRFVAGWTVAALLAPPVQGAELKPQTVAAFDRYIRATEARMGDDLREDHFLVIDHLPDDRRRAIDAQLREGKVEIEQLHTEEEGRAIPIPGGMIQHWVGVVFIPKATFAQTRAVLEDYDRQEIIYKPDVRRSKLLERNGNETKIYLQLYKRSIVTVVLNANFDIHYTQLSPTRAEAKSYSTRIAEIENLGTPDERELPVGSDHGYMWRLYSYWRIEERDGGVYFQLEVVALGRRVPLVFEWLVNPIIRNISRSTITNLLNKTREAVMKQNASAGSVAGFPQGEPQPAVDGPRTAAPPTLLGSRPPRIRPD